MVGYPSDDIDGRVGHVSIDGLRTIENTFVDLEPLIKSSEITPSLIAPRFLRIHLSDGIDQAPNCRFDIVWYQAGHYYFHYADSHGINWRFDRHPKHSAPNKHFHKPPDAASSETDPSCIAVEIPSLVAMAVWKMFHAAYTKGNFSQLNEDYNPP